MKRHDANIVAGFSLVTSIVTVTAAAARSLVSLYEIGPCEKLENAAYVSLSLSSLFLLFSMLDCVTIHFPTGALAHCPTFLSYLPARQPFSLFTAPHRDETSARMYS